MMAVIVMPERCARALQKVLDRFVLTTNPDDFMPDEQRDISEGLVQFSVGLRAAQKGQSLTNALCPCEPCEGDHE
jgi:hypothetical protein